MNAAATESEGREGLKGFLCALSAFLIWGLSPLYWKTLQGVPAFEIVLHRVVWSFLSVQLWTFALIWSALALYTIDSMLLHRKVIAPWQAASRRRPERNHRGR